MQLSESEALLVQRLRERPELAGRLREILEIVRTRPGKPRKADEIEDLLVEAIRALGRDAMESWALGAEREAGDEAKRRDPSLHVSKKNT